MGSKVGRVRNAYTKIESEKKSVYIEGGGGSGFGQKSLIYPTIFENLNINNPHKTKDTRQGIFKADPYIKTNMNDRTHSNELPNFYPRGVTYFSSWIDITKEQPSEGSIIDVWQGYVNSDTGLMVGFRLPNAWVSGGLILHGKECLPVRSVTHWRHIPESPING